MADTILVTGGCGYLGSQLIRQLAESAPADRTIRVLDNLQQGSVRALMNLPETVTYEFVEGDLLDPAQLRRALANVHRVVHLAAVVRTPLSFENPAWMEQINHWGTAHLAEACLEAGVKHLLLASSTAVYGPGGPVDEGASCRPQGPYAQSKWAAEETVRQAAERGLHSTIVRLGTLYGLAPVMRFDAVANRFAFLAGIKRRLPIYGSGEQRRPLVHVADAARALHVLLNQPPLDSHTTYNVVAQNPSINELAQVMQQCIPETAVHYTEQDIRTHYSFEIMAERIRLTGWAPQVSLEAGLRVMIEAFRALRPLSFM